MANFAEHFPLEQMIKSDTADAQRIDNTPPMDLLDSLAEVSQKAEEARAILGVPLRVDSGYRSPALNAVIARGSSSTGAHPKARAVDLAPMGMGLKEAYAMLVDHPTFMENVDQLINERGCIHLGLLIPGDHPAPRRELRHDEWINGVRHYPLDGIWKPKPTEAP